MGIPRLVSSLCDSALQTGFAMQVPRITPSIIHEAAKDLEMHEVPKETPLNRNHETVAPEPVPVLAAANVAAVNQPDKLQTIADRQDKRGTGVSMPMESYSNRQRESWFSRQSD